MQQQIRELVLDLKDLLVRTMPGIVDQQILIFLKGLIEFTARLLDAGNLQLSFSRLFSRRPLADQRLQTLARMVQTPLLALLIGKCQLFRGCVAMQTVPHGPLFLRHAFIQIVRFKTLKLIRRIPSVLANTRPCGLCNHRGNQNGDECKNC